MVRLLKFVFPSLFVLLCTYLFAQDFSKDIIIDANYNLHGDTLRIKKGCHLIFRGGKIDNGVIIGNETRISIKQDTPAFGVNLTIDGKWRVKNVYDRWFEFDSRPTFVANRIIRNILALSNDATYCHIHFNEPRVYYYQLEYNGRPDVWNLVSYSIDKGKKNWDEIYFCEKFSSLRLFTIPSNTHLTINNTLKMLPTEVGAYFVFWEYDKKNIIVDGSGIIYGDCKRHIFLTDKKGNYTYSGEWGVIFRCFKCCNFQFRDLTISDAFGDAICFNGSRYTYEQNDRRAFGLKMENVTIQYARRNGLTVSATNVRIENCLFEGCGIDEIKGTAPRAAVDFETDDIDLYPETANVNVIMNKCVFKNNKHDVSSTNNNLPSYGRFATIIKNCNFTAPIRFNSTYWIRFVNCSIPEFTNWIDDISEKTPFMYIQFENCIIKSMPIVVKSELWHNSFVNCEILNVK